jgi:formate dehydrogenase maturation protein FdhE
MFYTDAKAGYYKAGVPRDLKSFFAKLGGLNCPNCGSNAAFSTLNEFADWSRYGHRNPLRCAVCQYEWFDE